MTRQDFEFIAEIVRETIADPDLDSCVKEPLTFHMSRKFADALAQTNPRFDRARFLRACGVA
jgi:hypothetical protein